MNLAKKTIQSHIDFFINGDFTWVDVDYRGDSWELTSEEYPEDNTANFLFTNSKTTFVIATDPVFADNQLKSATVTEIEKLYDY